MGFRAGAPQKPCSRCVPAERSEPECRSGQAATPSALWALSVFALCVAACVTDTAPVRQPFVTPAQALKREAATRSEIESVVFDAQRAGFERRDLAGYMSAWTADGRLIAGRTELDGPHDVTLTHSQIEATKRERLPHLPDLRLSFDVQHFEHDGKTALLRTLSSLFSEAHFEQNAELYRLRRDGGRWRVYENRYWPVRVVTERTDVVYGSDTWRKLDAAVEETAAGTIERAYALVAAFRVREAYAKAARLTDAHARSLPAWYLRSDLALRVGAVEDIQMCNESIARLESR